jgi:peroxiredoxin
MTHEEMVNGMIRSQSTWTNSMGRIGGMRSKVLYLLALGFILSPFLSTAAEERLLQLGDPLPNITLPLPESAVHQQYLGLTGKGSFRIPDIKADLVIVEILSMYCPHCQKEAPLVNNLYQTIEEHPTAKGRVKLIGIGVGNDSFEVDIFRKKYEIKFPIFADEDYTVHHQCGKPGTPFFFGVKLNDGGRYEIIHTQAGGFENPDDFLQMMLKKSGLA